jgi:hypothetical protein
MLKGKIIYCTEDAAFDSLSDLKDFQRLNIHHEHDGDIEKVSFEKNDNVISFKSEDKEALDYVMGFASENEDDVRYKCLESIV